MVDERKEYLTLAKRIADEMRDRPRMPSRLVDDALKALPSIDAVVPYSDEAWRVIEDERSLLFAATGVLGVVYSPWLRRPFQDGSALARSKASLREWSGAHHLLQLRALKAGIGETIRMQVRTASSSSERTRAETHLAEAVDVLVNRFYTLLGKWFFGGKPVLNHQEYLMTGMNTAPWTAFKLLNVGSQVAVRDIKGIKLTAESLGDGVKHSPLLRRLIGLSVLEFTEAEEYMSNNRTYRAYDVIYDDANFAATQTAAGRLEIGTRPAFEVVYDRWQRAIANRKRFQTRGCPAIFNGLALQVAGDAIQLAVDNGCLSNAIADAYANPLPAHDLKRKVGFGDPEIRRSKGSPARCPFERPSGHDLPSERHRGPELSLEFPPSAS